MVNQDLHIYTFMVSQDLYIYTSMVNQGWSILKIIPRLEYLNPGKEKGIFIIKFIFLIAHKQLRKKTFNISDQSDGKQQRAGPIIHHGYTRLAGTYQ